MYFCIYCLMSVSLFYILSCLSVLCVFVYIVIIILIITIFYLFFPNYFILFYVLNSTLLFTPFFIQFVDNTLILFLFSNIEIGELMYYFSNTGYTQSDREKFRNWNQLVYRENLIGNYQFIKKIQLRIISVIENRGFRIPFQFQFFGNQSICCLFFNSASTFPLRFCS